MPDLPLRHADGDDITNVLTGYLNCRQGEPGEPYRTECPIVMREPGAYDVWPLARRGQTPTCYPMIEAS